MQNKKVILPTSIMGPDSNKKDCKELYVTQTSYGILFLITIYESRNCMHAALPNYCIYKKKTMWLVALSNQSFTKILKHAL